MSYAQVLHSQQSCVFSTLVTLAGITTLGTLAGITTRDSNNDEHQPGTATMCNINRDREQCGNNIPGQEQCGNNIPGNQRCA